MKRISIATIVLLFCMIMPVFAATKKKYFVKFMPRDYSNWVWSELKDVKSCTKTSDGNQYVIVYTGVEEPRAIIPTWEQSKETKPIKTITMTTGVDNVMILEFEE